MRCRAICATIRHNGKTPECLKPRGPNLNSNKPEDTFRRVGYHHAQVQPRSGRGAETHIFKANHPDDAANWLADFRVSL